MNNILIKVRLLLQKIKKDDLTAWASMLTLYLMLSLFPLIIILTDLIARSSFNDPSITEYLVRILPGPVYETIKAIATDIELNQSNKVISVALLVAFWAASRGVLAIIHALNKAYNISESRSYFKLRFLAFIYTISFIALILSSLLLIVFGNTIYSFIEQTFILPEFMDTVVSILRFAITILFSLIFFIFLYNLSPTVRLGVVKVLPGAIFSALGITGASSVFSIYVKYSTSLSYLYGSLTGFMILILWLFIISLIIMVGGEVNAVFVSNRFNHLKDTASKNNSTSD